MRCRFSALDMDDSKRGGLSRETTDLYTSSHLLSIRGVVLLFFVELHSAVSPVASLRLTPVLNEKQKNHPTNA